MGNGSSCRLAVRIDEPQRSHKAGETVTGRIYFTPSSKDNLSTYQGINLVLVGQEHFKISRNNQADSHHNNRQYQQMEQPLLEDSTKMLVRTEYPIVQFEGRLQPGQYEYPFRLRLPPGLPSSMRYRKELETDCYILGEVQYTLSAKVVSQNRNFTGREGRVRDSLTLNVRANAAGLQGNVVPRDDATYPIRACMFWQKGEIRMGWQANTDVCAPGGVLSVDVSGENNSGFAVQALSVKLVETVSLCSSHQDASRQQRSFPRTVAKKTVPVEHVACWKPHCHDDILLLAEINQSHRIELRVPLDVRDSYAGDLVQVRHTLVITAETPGFCTVTSPESACQIQIAPVEGNQNETTAIETSVAPSAPLEDMNPSYENTQMVQAEFLPADWKPIVADNVVVLPVACAVLVDAELYPPSAACASSNYTASTAAAPAAPSEFLLDVASPYQRHPAVAPTVNGLQELVEVHPESLSATLQDSSWATLVQNLSPRDFCSTVQRAGHDAPNVARTLALTMGPSMQTRHLLACLYALQDSTQRMEVLKQIAPLTSDISANRAILEKELSRDELAHFQAALKGRK